MKRFVSMLTVLLALGACSNHEGPEGNPSQVPQTATLYHGMIQLGEKLEDPYTVENMRAALTKAYPTKADRIDITATDLYVRFLPVDDDQLKELEGMGLYLMDHPMDYRIVREGDYYQDPDVGEEAITWQYAVVPQDFVFPEGIQYELLDECYLAEHDPTTRGDLGIDWELVEREAFRLTGHEDLLAPQTKGPAAAPAGRITIEDPNFSGGKPFGVAGVKVVCNIFIKIATCYTDRDGYYQMEKKFSGNPRYRIVFQNEKGFCIGFNWIIVPASVSTLGKAEPQGMDVHALVEGRDLVIGGVNIPHARGLDGHSDADVLIIDCFGLLSSIYHYGEIAYVGGGFGVGIHNVLEAAVWDVPVFFGPNNQRFQEAQGLKAAGGGFDFETAEAFERQMDIFLKDAEKLRVAGEKAGLFVQGLAGATEKVLSAVDL